MGFYRLEPTISPSDNRASPATVTQEIDENWIEEISVYYPAGQRNAVKVAVLVGERFLYPSQTDTYVGGSDFRTNAPIQEEVRGKDPQITVKGISNANNLDHEVLVDVKTLPRAIGKWKQNIATVANAFANPMAQVRDVREGARDLIGEDTDKSQEAEQ